MYHPGTRCYAKDPAARDMAAAGGRTDGSGGVGGGGSGEGGGGGGAWLRDADAYMSSSLLLTTSQQVLLAPYFNRQMARRDEPRTPGGALNWSTLKVRTYPKP
jgi:hypothetical protein